MNPATRAKLTQLSRSIGHWLLETFKESLESFLSAESDQPTSSQKFILSAFTTGALMLFLGGCLLSDTAQFLLYGNQGGHYPIRQNACFILAIVFLIPILAFAEHYQKHQSKQPKPHLIFTYPGCVVTYEPTSASFNQAFLEQQLLQIFNANPHADLTKMEIALGIKIIDIQRKGSSSPEDEGPYVGY